MKIKEIILDLNRKGELEDVSYKFYDQFNPKELFSKQEFTSETYQVMVNFEKELNTLIEKYRDKIRRKS